MPYIIVRHKVQDFVKWKPVYDQHAATRKAGGSKGATLFRNIDNPNEVIVLLEWDSVDKARKFAQSEDLRQTMQKAGVAERPDIYYVDQVQRTPS